MGDEVARPGFPLNVGDTGVVVGHYRRGRMPATVVKVGRKWATVEPSWLGRFDRNTGHQEGDYATDRFLTHDAEAYEQTMNKASDTITRHGLSFKMGHRWSDANTLALAAWLRGHFDGDDIEGSA